MVALTGHRTIYTDNITTRTITTWTYIMRMHTGFGLITTHQGCPQDVKSQDRDETETVNLQDRDETFQKRIQTAV